jgi:hypothetical protein
MEEASPQYRIVPVRGRYALQVRTWFIVPFWLTLCKHPRLAGAKRALMFIKAEERILDRFWTSDPIR